MVAVQLRQPALDLLPDYVNALKRGWSSDNVRGAAAAAEELRSIARDAAAFVALQDDRDAKGAPITMPDGSAVPRLPGYRRWLWDGEFCGSIGFRWQKGTSTLPGYVLGHIGYAVVPWKQRRGYATQALRPAAPRGPPRRPRSRRHHDGSGQHRVAESDTRQWRSAGRAVSPPAVLWRHRPASSLPHRPLIAAGSRIVRLRAWRPSPIIRAPLPCRADATVGAARCALRGCVVVYDRIRGYADPISRPA